MKQKCKLLRLHSEMLTVCMLDEIKTAAAFLKCTHLSTTVALPVSRALFRAVVSTGGCCIDPKPHGAAVHVMQLHGAVHVPFFKFIEKLVFLGRSCF
jgi:hypothetical protein